jgi:hypothetical protein
VSINVYPPLQKYIKEVLQETLNLLNANKLKRFEIRIHNEEKVLQSFVFDINLEDLDSSNLNELEEAFRNCIHSLENRCKLFKKASKDCRFKILLHTDSYQDYAGDSKTLDFLWIEDNQKVPNSAKGIVPIVMESKSNLFQFYVEQFR